MEVLPKLITKKEIIDRFENEKQYSNWIAQKLKSKTITKIRSNLYALIDPSTNDIYSSKFEIASKISENSFLCYHSALEYYGIANQVFSDILVGSLTRFNNFVFKENEFICKLTKNIKFVNNIINEGIKVTSLEKTIVDCIDNIDLAGGIEEVLNALEQTKYLNESKLLDILKDFNKKFLYQKVGFLLELYNTQFDLSADFFKKCKSHISKKTNYFLQDEYKDIEFNATWNLMAPKNIKSRINGGY
jgi:predicted transcriptional regulator of viral defense system